MKYVFLLVMVFFSYYGYSQYDVSSLLGSDLDPKSYNQFVGEVNYYHLDPRPIKNEKRACIYGDCKNGQSAVTITFKGGLYYDEKDTKSLFIAGNFENGKLQGEGFIFHSMDKKARSTLSKLLKAGEFTAAWNVQNVRPKLRGVFNANIITHGTFVAYYKQFVPYIRQALDGDEDYYSSIINESLTARLFVEDDILRPDFNDLERVSFTSTDKSALGGTYRFDAVKEFPSLKQLTKQSGSETSKYLFDGHYILKDLGVTIKETPNKDWEIKINSGFGHSNRIQIDTVIPKPIGSVKTINGVTMFANYDGENKG